MNIMALADRLHKTPDEIRRGFSLDDYVAFMAHLSIVEQERK